MLIQHFTMHHRRVPDPMQPGRTALVGVLAASGNSSVSHDGVEYEPDEAGWIDVPHEVGQQLLQFRHQGSGFYTPAQVDEEIRLGRAEEPISAAPKKTARKTPASG